MDDPGFDIAVIGAGMAGASLAFELARAGVRVVLLERESQPGYHTTGRSAALYAPLYGNPAVRALTRASRQFFDAPPAGFASGATAAPLLRPRAAVFYAGATQSAELDAFLAGFAGESLRPRLLTHADAVRAHVPTLRPEAAAGGGALDLSASDIDVAAMLQGCLRGARAHGAQVRLRFELARAERDAGGWILHAAAPGEPPVRAGRVAVCAGAWADPLAAVLGVAAPLIEPRRRTALVLDCGPAPLPADAPIAISIVEDFYFRPEAGHVFASPADETPSPPCDAQPDELDVAIAIDRLARDTTLGLRRVVARWAGLRSFHADRSPVADYALRADGTRDDTVFWMVGQGGYGIQMAPALAEYGAACLLGRPLPATIAAEGFDPVAVASGRDSGG